MTGRRSDAAARFRPERVQLRLLALVMLAVLPALLLTVWTASEMRTTRAHQQQGQALRLARAAAMSNERLLEGAEQLLSALAQVDVVRRAGPGCDELLERVLEAQRPYLNLGVARSDGDVVCSALPLEGRISIADRTYFQRAMKSGGFSVGDYQRGRITGERGLNLGLPVFVDGDPSGIVFAALDLRSFDTLAADTALPDGAAVLVIDSSGTILARYPQANEYVGRRIPDEAIVRTIMARGVGTADTTGIDGVRRLYGFTSIGAVPGPSAIYVAFGIPREHIFADIDRLAVRSIVAIGIVGLAALFLAWFLGTRFLVRPIREAFERESEANARLREADDIKNAFLAAVSHDLRSPVAAIRGFADVLAGNLGAQIPADDVPKLADRIGVNARRVDRLITGLLDVDRLSRGAIEPHRQPRDVREVVDGVVGDLELAPKLHANIAAVVADVDPVQLERIIENLLTNAMRHTPRGAEVWLYVERFEAGILVRVEDSGSGVPEGLKERIFEPFQRAAEHTPGVGVGLHLVRRFAELHGGRAWVEDREGGGASFRVYLPATVTDVEEARAGDADAAVPPDGTTT